MGQTPRSGADYEIVTYRPALRSQILALQTHLWGHDLDPAVCADYLDWKYTRNPYVDTTLIYVAIRAGQVVGMRGLYGAKWRVGQPAQELVSLCAGDLVIAPDHRNSGVFPKLTRAALSDAAERGYTHIFNFSPSVTTYLGFAAMGWRALGSVESMGREPRWRPLARRIREGGYRLASGVWRHARRLPVAQVAWQSVKRLSAARARTRRRPFERLDVHAANATRSGRGRVLVSHAPEPEAMAELVERIGTDGRIRHVRDPEYFTWRFGNPLSWYRFLFWKDGGRLEGYLVLQTSIFAGRTGTNIVDWEVSSAKVRAEMLGAAIRWGGFTDLAVWSATLADDTRTLLRDAGFSRTMEAAGVTAARHRILVRPVDENIMEQDWVLGDRRLLDITNWDLRMIDSDFY